MSAPAANDGEMTALALALCMPPCITSSLLNSKLPVSGCGGAEAVISYQSRYSFPLPHHTRISTGVPDRSLILSNTLDNMSIVGINKRIDTSVNMLQPYNERDRW